MRPWRIARSTVCALIFSLQSPIASAELSTSDFFRAWQFQNAVLSPTGDLVATLRLLDGWLRVDLVEPQRANSVRLFRAEERLGPRVDRLVWLDADTLALSYRMDDVPHGETVEDRHRDRNVIFDIKRRDGKLGRKWVDATIEGKIVQPLPLDDEFLLFQPAEATGELYRVRPSDLTKRVAGSKTGLPEAALVASFDDWVGQWICDPDGTPRVVLTIGSGGKWRVRYRGRGEQRWKTVLSGRIGSKALQLFPVALSEDGTRIIMASTRDTSTISLREFDPATKKVGAVLYERPRGDFKNLIFDHSRSRIRGVSYIEAGRTRFHYFDIDDDARRHKLDTLFAGSNTTVMDSSSDGEVLIVHVGSSDDAGSVWYVDLRSGFREELGRVAPWLERDELAEVRSFHVTSADGYIVEAMIALPKNLGEPPPLVVFPHGGPIGVMDDVEFSPEVQHLANGGFAVLQVNYRGSSGYGEEFLSAGKRQWGRGIEDDIDAAVAHAIEQGWVDQDRMCIVGASYGGFSALMTIIRHPKRYRCAATHAGVTDIPLILSTADSATTSEDREGWYDILGNPRTDYDSMKAVSPVYRVAEIEVPLMITHGSVDERVHIEHADRLRLMLDAHDKIYDWHLLEGQGHYFASREDVIAYYSKLKNFLWDNLWADASQPLE